MLQGSEEEEEDGYERSLGGLNGIGFDRSLECEWP